MMESKLEEAINTNEFYSAHQLLISQSQRNQRSGNINKSKDILSTGIVKLSKSSQLPSPILYDLFKKYVEILERICSDSFQKPEELEELFNQAVERLELILAKDDIVSWEELFGRIYNIFTLKSSNLTLLLLKYKPKDQIISWFLSHHPNNQECFEILAKSNSNDKESGEITQKVIIELIVKLILMNCFGSANSFLQSLDSKNRSNSGWYASSCLLALAQRQLPPKDLMSSWEEKYGHLISKDLLDGFKNHIWPPKRNMQNIAANPLASLLQNMMMGGIGGGPAGGNNPKNKF